MHKQRRAQDQRKRWTQTTQSTWPKGCGRANHAADPDPAPIDANKKSLSNNRQQVKRSQARCARDQKRPIIARLTSVFMWCVISAWNVSVRKREICTGKAMPKTKVTSEQESVVPPMQTQKRGTDTRKAEHSKLKRKGANLSDFLDFGLGRRREPAQQRHLSDREPANERRRMRRPMRDTHSGGPDTVRYCKAVRLNAWERKTKKQILTKQKMKRYTTMSLAIGAVP